MDRDSLAQQLAAGVRHFVQRSFDDADLSRMDLQDCVFERCTFSGTILYASKMARSNWQRCRGMAADFESADLVDTQFEGCDLNNSKWRRAKLASAGFRACKLTGAAFEEVSHLGASFEECLLVGADMRGFSFRKATLNQLDFSDADLSGCDFREAVLEGCSLREAVLKLTRFEGADLRGADLGGLKLADVRAFKGAVISHSQAAAIMGEMGLVVA
ncbi:pentapeptide repeat-containing protein [Pseudoduganella sp. HUAS MS19]